MACSCVTFAWAFVDYTYLMFVLFGTGRGCIPQQKPIPSEVTQERVVRYASMHGHNVTFLHK